MPNTLKLHDNIFNTIASYPLAPRTCNIYSRHRVAASILSDNTLRIRYSNTEMEILKKFRENEDPTLGQIDGKSIETLHKEELIKEAKKRGVDPINLCNLGAIDPRQENLCVILHYAEEVKNKAVPSGSAEPAENTGAEPPRKKAKAATTEVSFIIFFNFSFFNLRSCSLMMKDSVSFPVCK